MAFPIDDANPVNHRATRFLIERGHFSDDECYGKTSVEQNGPEIERVARLFGYGGGEIKTAATFVPGNGNVYLAYDSERLSHADAMEILKNSPVAW